MKRKTLDELVVRLGIETKKFLDHKEMPREERRAAYRMLVATVKYAEKVGYKAELLRLTLAQYNDERRYMSKNGREE